MSTLYTSKEVRLKARAHRNLLTTTDATTIFSFTPRKTGLYQITPYVQVGTAATDLTLALAWTDPDAGAQTYDWYNDASVPVGVAMQGSRLIVAQGGKTVSLTATAGTANNIKVSTTVLEVG